MCLPTSCIIGPVTIRLSTAPHKLFTTQPSQTHTVYALFSHQSCIQKRKVPLKIPLKFCHAPPREHHALLDMFSDVSDPRAAHPPVYVLCASAARDLCKACERSSRQIAGCFKSRSCIAVASQHASASTTSTAVTARRGVVNAKAVSVIVWRVHETRAAIAFQLAQRTARGVFLLYAYITRDR